jgi:hypothetical protein
MISSAVCALRTPASLLDAARLAATAKAAGSGREWPSSLATRTVTSYLPGGLSMSGAVGVICDIPGARWPSPADDMPMRLPSHGKPSAAPPRWSSSAARALAVVVSALTPAEVLIAARQLAGARPHLAALAGIVHPEDLSRRTARPTTGRGRDDAAAGCGHRARLVCLQLGRATRPYRAALAGAKAHGLDAKTRGGERGVVFFGWFRPALPAGDPEPGSLEATRVSPVP